MIAAYLDQLRALLRFDPSLAKRVIAEAQDHLEEAAAREPAPDRREAERRVIARFGDPSLIAAQFAAVSLARHSRRVGVALVLTVVAVMALMKIRVAWYDVIQLPLNEEVREIARLVLTVDRLAFWSAAVSGIVTLLYIARERTPAVADDRCQRYNRRVTTAFAWATGSLAMAVLCDSVLMVLRIGPSPSNDAIVPVASLVIEIVCIGAIIYLIRVASRRASAVSALAQ
jgi:hypothetical protein